VTHVSEIDGVVITELRQIRDERGAVLHMLRCDSPEFTRFGECYFSEIFFGVVKAWKLHRAQTQHLAVPIGRIRLVIYDDREGSPTRSKMQVIELGRPDAYLRITIPPKLWYGFGGISRAASLLVNCVDLPHLPSESDFCSVDSGKIPYSWVTTTNC
jgi:dTDP-4-dehydrorhamnose 3,5-epimerase